MQGLPPLCFGSSAGLLSKEGECWEWYPELCAEGKEDQHDKDSLLK